MLALPDGAGHEPRETCVLPGIPLAGRRRSLTMRFGYRFRVEPAFPPAAKKPHFLPQSGVRQAKRR